MHLSEPRLDVAATHASTVDWERIYELDSFSLPTQSKSWSKAILGTTRAVNYSRKYMFSDGIEAILPLYSGGRGPHFLRVLRSPPPAWGFGGPISTTPLNSAHIRLIFDDCRDLPAAAVQIRPNPLQAASWADAAPDTDWQALERNAYTLDLAGGFDEVWNKRFPGRTRNKVRKAERSGVTVKSGTSEDLISAFDHLFRLSISRWAQRQQEFGWLASLRGHMRDPRRKFAKMAQLSDGISRISIAWLDGTPVAGIVVLAGRNAHYTRGAMDISLIGKTMANYLLQKLAIEYACSRSCNHYHMGETSPSSSLARFKSGFGAVAVPYAEYRYEHVPLLSADQRLRSVVKNVIGFKDA